MQLIKKIFNSKTSKSALTVGLVTIFFQILIATYPIIKPISLIGDLTLFYGIVIIELIIFPISLSIVFSYILDKIKWLEKKSFLITFIVASLLIVATVILGRLAWEHIIPWEFWLFYKYLETPLAITGLIGIPFIYLLGWSGWTVFTFVMIIGIFVTAFLVASLFSYTTYLAINKKNRFFRIILTAVLILCIGWGIFQAINKAYVKRLSLEGECVVGLNFYQCDNYINLGSSYHRLNDGIYYNLGYANAIKMDDVDIDSFEVIKSDSVRMAFAKDKYRAYANGEIIPINNIDSWKIMEGVDNWGYSSDDKNVFFGVNILDGANPESTFVIENKYACNNDFVYFGEKIIEDADPSSFVTLNCGGYTKDDKSYYFYGEKIDADKTECGGEDAIDNRCKLE